ncbi:MAG: sigma-70 family RNA polymerase sigma factor [Pyrinomonadaceae bacterium]
MVSEDEEFTTFFNESYPSLCRFLECLLAGRGRGAAQDLAQESFIQLYRTGLSSFPPDEAKFWLYRVARNLALNEINKHSVRQRLFDKVVDALRPRPQSPVEELELVEQKKILMHLMQFLPEHQRAALLLREQEEMSYRDIARVLNISESKVKVDIFRARTTLREGLSRPQQLVERESSAPPRCMIKGVLP